MSNAAVMRNEAIASNAMRLLWAGFLAIFAAGIGAGKPLGNFVTSSESRTL